MQLATYDILRSRTTLIAANYDRPDSREPGPDEVRCTCCGHILPHTPEFFWSTYRRVDGTACLGSRCKACRTEAAHRCPSMQKAAKPSLELHRIIHSICLKKP